MAYRLVVFDMDGTLTRPVLDFDAIRAEIGLPPGPVLEGVRQLSGADRERAEAVLHRHEAHAALNSELQPGAAELVAALRTAGLHVVLMTRNTLRSTIQFEERHGLKFDMVWSRESGPMKPSPEPVLAICARFGVTPAETVCIGDFHFDLICARHAGAVSVLFLQPDFERPDWACDADWVIRELAELPGLMGLDAGLLRADRSA